MNALRDGRRIHFVGIGGAGMSALAIVLLQRGAEVTGSDLKPSRATRALEAMGARVSYGHDAAAVTGAGAVVVSAAIPESNPELAAARAGGIEVLGRGAALAELLASSTSVVVAGTHGKTTTTSMIVSILRAAGRDPTFLVGGGLNDSGTNAKSGQDEITVAESDESDGSFLLLRPQAAVVTNVELDHVDHWGSAAELDAAFARFVASARECAVLPVDAEGLLAAAAGRRIVRWGPGGDVDVADVHEDGAGSDFELVVGDGRYATRLEVPGRHNIANALAAAGACLALGLEPSDIARGLASFRGVERRFQVKGAARGVTVVDDYAHHPTEVRATLAAARPGPWRRVIALFQPHRYSRTKAFAAAFGDAFADADRIVITDVYGAGEHPVPGVTGKLVADAVTAALPGRPVAYLPHRPDLVAYLAGACRSGDVVVTLGAGDVSSVADEVLEILGGGAH